MAIIELNHVSRTYGDGASQVRALEDVSLHVEPGEFLTISGSSGSGKTTLLNIIGALDRPTDGSVVVDGFALAQATDGRLSDFRNETIGFIFQAYHLEPAQNSLENVAVSLLFSGTGRRERRRRALEQLGSVGLTPQAKQAAGALSAGQKRRLTIARALVKKPKIILADEPTANLDRANIRDVLSLLGTANKQDKVTVLLVSHEEASIDMADRVVRLENGKILDGS